MNSLKSNTHLKNFFLLSQFPNNSNKKIADYLNKLVEIEEEPIEPNDVVEADMATLDSAPR